LYLHAENTATPGVWSVQSTGVVKAKNLVSFPKAMGKAPAPGYGEVLMIPKHAWVSFVAHEPFVACKTRHIGGEVKKWH